MSAGVFPPLPRAADMGRRLPRERGGFPEIPKIVIAEVEFAEVPRERGGFPYRTPEQELAAVLAHNILGAYVTYRLCGQSSKTESTPGS